MTDLSAATLCPRTGFVPGAVAWDEMISHRSYLVRFARRRLHDPMLAEDLVHDVFEAVMAGSATFGGRSTLRTWLTAVLRNKLVDFVRDRAHYRGLEAAGSDDEVDVPWDIASEEAGPSELAEQRQQLAQVLARIEQLPAGLRDVMRWRVLNDEPTEAVCERLSISQENLFVRLHRARRQLVC